MYPTRHPFDQIDDVKPQEKIMRFLGSVMGPEPDLLGIVAQIWLPNMPAGLDEHSFKWVHCDAIVGAMPGGMCVVIAAPVLLFAPIDSFRIPVPG